jgi:hypothetical protein
MTLTVVPLRDGKPSLNDTVAQIRAFADRIEAGDYGDVEAVFALMPRENDYPKFWGWGNVSGINDPVVQLELAKLWLLTNLVTRDP